MKGLRKMGKKRAEKMNFWSMAEYRIFAEQIEGVSFVHGALALQARKQKARQ